MGRGGVGWEALWAVMFADDIVFCGEGGERVEAGELGLCFGERGSGVDERGAEYVCVCVCVRGGLTARRPLMGRGGISDE